MLPALEKAVDDQVGHGSGVQRKPTGVRDAARPPPGSNAAHRVPTVPCTPFARRLASQAAGAKSFSLDVSLAVLRLYALQPNAARREIGAKILLSALAQLPANDYKTCMYLVHDRTQVRRAS